MLRRTLLLSALTCLVVWSPISQAAKAQIMGVEEARDAALKNELLLVDIRRPEEWRESGIGDVSRPLDMTEKGFIQKLIELRADQPDARLGLICATGVRSKYVASFLIRNGITGVVDVSAGMHGQSGWLAKKLPVKQP